MKILKIMKSYLENITGNTPVLSLILSSQNNGLGSEPVIDRVIGYSDSCKVSYTAIAIAT